MINLIDTHFHLDFYKNHKEIYNDINKLHQYTLCVTNSPEVYEECQKVYFNTKYLKFALGFNPKSNNSEENFRMFLNKFKGAMYIGEVGLDFSRQYKNVINEQIRYFDKIVEMCSSTNKILSVHTKNAEDKIIEIVKKHRPKKCIIHWFTGNEEQLKKLIDSGCYFSINANMVFQNNTKLFLIPKDKLLIESDGPFTKVNGKKYEPRFLAEKNEIISSFYNEKNLKEIVYKNFKTILTL